ncbi:MAG: TetR family transcriptional regulator [Acidobacteria bacterium]|jgi:AcrR family transcriptional regulator|nr:MAG: TetR family transcriptional regulator [Acidobacteriota bacterium]
MGRPRSFDLNKALDRALHLFWRKGYEGTSLSDLTKTMGINRPSLYAAFGDKEALFRKALERYRGGPAAYTQEALNETTARAVVERLLRGAADLTTAPRNPGGCLTVQGALACSEAGDSIRQELTACRAAGEAAIRRRLEHAKSNGDLPADTDPADLARYVATIVYGIAVQAAGSARRGKLQRVIEMALRTLPL